MQKRASPFPCATTESFPVHLLPIVQKCLCQAKRGIGIYNVNQRLVQLLGSEAGLRIRNLPGGGSEVKFFVPKYERLKEKKVIG